MSAPVRFALGASAFAVGTLIGYVLREWGDRLVVALLLSRPWRWSSDTCADCGAVAPCGHCAAWGHR